MNTDGTISQVTPVSIKETKLVALSTKTTKLKESSPKECSTCRRKPISQNTPIFCKTCLKIKPLLNAPIMNTQENLDRGREAIQ